jgi:hypothetical protein
MAENLKFPIIPRSFKSYSNLKFPIAAVINKLLPSTTTKI